MAKNKQQNSSNAYDAQDVQDCGKNKSQNNAKNSAQNCGKNKAQNAQNDASDCK